MSATASWWAAPVHVSRFSFVTNVLNNTTGDLTTTIHLQGATPNDTYYANVIADNPSTPGYSSTLGYSAAVHTDAWGNGTATVVNHDPIAANITVKMFDPSYTSFFQSSVKSLTNL
ncbi:MAG TPA: hypothetical protein VIX84_01820 [Acidimicrobiales bacterium]